MKEIPLLDYDEHEYDPATSEMIAEWRLGGESAVFRSGAETLYKTAKGGYFLLSEGGPLTRPRFSPGTHVWYGGSSILPLSVQDALSWCEETGNYEAIDRHFRHLGRISW